MPKVLFPVLWTFVAAFSIQAALLSLPASADPLTLRIGTYVPEKSVGVQKVIRPWMTSVLNDTAGEIEFKEYWGGALGRDPKAQYDLVRYGILDIAWVLPSYTPGQFRQIQITELPYLAENATECSIAAWRLYEAGHVKGLDDVHVIGIWTTEMATIQMRQVITGLDDVRNKRIRTAGAVQARFMQAVGAAPQTMDSIEMNEALQRGTIDGLVQGWTGIRTFRTDQLVSGAYEAPSGAIPFLLLMNKQRWDQLPEAVQTAMSTHGGLAMAQRAGEAYDGLVEEIRTRMWDEGRYRSIIVPDADENQTNFERIRSVHDDWIRETSGGREAYDAFVAELKRVRQKKTAQAQIDEVQ